MIIETDQAPAAAARQYAAACQIALSLQDDAPLQRSLANKAMTAAFGSASADGAWTQRDSFVAIEVASILALRATRLPKDPKAILHQLAQFESRLPTQTVRSEEQVAAQHFSTPLGLAWLVAHLAVIGADDIVLEPSAGIGMLATWAGQGKALHLNELDPVRAALLRHLFPKYSVTTFNAAQINQHFSARPTVVIMNPPFARNVAGKEDPFAAHRHFVSALAALAPGGRIVAIMPDSFSPQGKHGSLFDRAVTGAHVRLMLRLDKGFAGKGTSVAVRIVVADKSPARSRAPATINRATVGALFESLREVPARIPTHPEPTPPPAPRRSGTSPLFGAFRAAGTKVVPRAAAPLPTFEIGTVDYAIRDAAAAIADDAQIYVPWQSQRLIFESAAAHPSPLVESAAMAAVPLPIPSYRPRLPKRVLDDNILSAAQLETVIHALEATEKDLPGKYSLRANESQITPDADGQRYRQGFFLGDGTGAGKGRQLAAIIMDQWLRGRRRHLWFSESSALLNDGRRDWQAVGGLALDLQPLSKLDTASQTSEGILFASYATLRTEVKGRRRVDQIIAWVGEDYDGLIIFDEAHAMGGVAGGEGRFGTTKGSQQGLAGVELQNRLPRARVIYASATGASDINNLAYATRLGLWGEGTAFPSREAFTARIRDGGVAAMELVARELKVMGVYIARLLSFAGVEYDILEHELTPEQIADFDTYADAWAIIMASCA